MSVNFPNQGNNLMYFQQPNALSMSNDFMRNSYFNQPNFQGGGSDTYEKSGQSGFVTGLELGAAAGVATGAGKYFLGTNIMKDGKVKEDFTEYYNEQKYNELLENEKKTVKEAEINKIKENKISEIKAKADVKTEEVYNALKRCANEGLDKLTDDEKVLLKPEITDKGTAEKKIAEIEKEINAIKDDDILKKAKANVDEKSLKVQNKELDRLAAAEAKIKNLSESATIEDIKKVVKDNLKTFDIKETEEPKINEAVNKLVPEDTTKKGFLDKYTKNIESVKKNIETIKNDNNAAIKNFVDKDGKFLESADDTFKAMVKDFKFGKALKWGGIATVTGLVLGWLFGGNSGNKQV